jgi:hypothetical protein
MKQPISWHKQNLALLKLAVLDLEGEFKMAKARMEYASRDLRELEWQIERAEREGRDSFDSERFNKPRQAGSTRNIP